MLEKTLINSNKISAQIISQEGTHQAPLGYVVKVLPKTGERTSHVTLFTGLLIILMSLLGLEIKKLKSK